MESEDEAGQPAGAPAGASAVDGSLEEQLAAAREEAARNLDGWQRAQAEFANARRRYEKGRVEAFAVANAEVAAKLLPIIDDFERAVQSAPESVRADSWFSGVELIRRKTLTILEGMGVEPVPALGQPFDPTIHEALGHEASTDYASGTVSREMQRGYRLGDKVIRPALVYVAE
jgi:molecular chaperone GrpE